MLPSVTSTRPIIEGDGDVDVLVVDESSISLYGNLENRLVFARALFVGSPIRDAIFADFDQNGLVDVLLERTSGEKELRRNIEGGFSHTDIPANDLPNLASLNSKPADLDRDGDLDLAGHRTVFLQDRPGAFIDAGSAAFASLMFPPEIHHMADFNRDGHVDILGRLNDPTDKVVESDGPLHVLLNDGLATFSNAIEIDVASGVRFEHVTVDDFNGDAIPDVLAGALFGVELGEVWFNEITPGRWHNESFGPDVNGDSGRISS